MATYSNYPPIQIFDSLPEHQKTIILADDVIKTLTTPVDILSAFGENKVIFPTKGALYLDSTAGAYTVGIGNFLTTSLVWNDGSQLKEALVGQNEFEGGNFYQSAAKEFCFLFPTLFSSSGTLYSPALDFVAIANQPLAIQIITDTGDLSDGNEANTLRLSFSYLVWDLLTGTFVWD